MIEQEASGITGLMMVGVLLIPWLTLAISEILLALYRWSVVRAMRCSAEDVAGRLLRAIGEGPQGRLPDYGGPARMTVPEAARLWRQARGVRKPILPFPVFNAAARAFRAGHNTLPADTPAENRGRVSWEEWLARPAAPHPY